MPRDLHSYLSNPLNKVNLVNYVFKTWAKTFLFKLQDNQILILTHLDGSTDKITCQSSSKFNWSTDHKEADSKMFVFCKYLLDNYNILRINISSPDTDVAVIACYQFVENLSLLDELWLKTGVGAKKRYIAIHDTSASLEPTLSRLLPVFHVVQK